MNLKRLLYYACKWTGCFAVARRITRRGLRILAYHGFVLDDEGRFRPLLFMDANAFQQRMAYLAKRGYPVLRLEDAVTGLSDGSLPPCATVITFDDGFYSILKLAVPVLQKFNHPGTIYVTTYYSQKENPIFRLAVQYLFWKTSCDELELKGLGLDDTSKARFYDERSRDLITWKIIDYAEKQLGEEERVRLCVELGKRLGVGYEDVVRSRLLTLMTKEEIREADKVDEVDIELHTHRHVLPEDAGLVAREIEDNRAVLEPLVGRRLNHFCYPSGIHHPNHLRPLAEAGVKSATTCDSGLNYSDTAPLLLNRFLDGNNVSMIEFEAEMSGFADLLRKARSSLSNSAGRDESVSEAA